MIQKTIIKPVQFQGYGLHTNKKSTVTLLPANINTGIVFQRVDLHSNQNILAVEANTSSFSRNTTITNKVASVSTIEHFMACFCLLGIDNLIVQVDTEEMPILDGSALPVYNALINNVKNLDCQKNIFCVNKEITFSDNNNAFIKALPFNGFKITITVEYPFPIGTQTVSVNLEENPNIVETILSSRTFVFLSELELLLNNNLIKGGTFDNAIVIADKILSHQQSEHLCKLFNKETVYVTDFGILNNIQLRNTQELVYHKLLDFIGDIYLIGKAIKGQFIAYKPGHLINSNFVKKLISE